MYEYDYGRITVIKVPNNSQHVIVQTFGLLVSRIFVDCYDHIPNAVPNEHGDFPFYVTQWYVNDTSPVMQQRFVYHKPHTPISDTIIMARIQHRRIVAKCKEFLRKRGSKWTGIDNGRMLREISVFPSITSNIPLVEKSFSRFL